MSQVKLAVRVRPFTERELRTDRPSEPVVRVEDEHTISITNLKVATSGAGDSRLRVRRYHADFCLDGSCAPDHPYYATQDTVYESVGRSVLESVRGGQSACVLAYGQSATGKTHTMLGTAELPGLVPRLCQDLAAEEQELTVSFLEIYNERVRDLLCEEVQGPAEGAGYNSLPRRRGNTTKDLRVREHPTKGPYVQNLRRVSVRGAEALCSLVWRGTARRHAAATRRNPASSRSHAVLQLATGTASLHLADLAGSEKAGLEGAYRGRQKEGANINKSLVALSNVISALVCGGGGGGRGRYVPYRDSALTWLLKDCFTGGGATFIVATVSPSGSCYGESASTLRWAARARQLPSHARARARAGPGAAGPAPPCTQRDLAEQLAALKVALLKNHIQFIPETGALLYDENFWKLKTNTGTSTNWSKCTDIEELAEEEMNSTSKQTTLDVNQFGSNESSIMSTSSDRLEDKCLKANEDAQTSIDNIFGPVLERTVSGHDLKVTAPLRNRRRQYRSHDVLPIMTKAKINGRRESTSSNVDITGEEKNESENFEGISVKSEDTPKLHVPYQVDNPRAEIVASVTERLYNTLKKKEESTVSKVENIIDKKIMEPLHELKICTNARQRLVEMSQRALRNRRKIGIPAQTQTQMRVARMKDQAIDVQNDLEPYCIKYNSEFKYYMNVHTETNSLTSRCREVGIGPATGSVYSRDCSTATDTAPTCRSNSVMTDDLLKSENSTQTQVMPPPRKKKVSAFTKYLGTNSSPTPSVPKDEIMNESIIEICISQTYPIESESLSDDSLETCTNDKHNSTVNMPPDLLSNHNSLDQDIQLSPVAAIECHNVSVKNSKEICGTTKHQSLNYAHVNRQNISPQSRTSNTVETAIKPETDEAIQISSVISPLEELFSDNDEHESLPRSLNVAKLGTEDMKNIILGRSPNIYPYNIVLSPLLERHNSGKKSVKFEQDGTSIPRPPSFVSVGTQTLYTSRWVDDIFQVASSDSLSNIDSDDCNRSAKSTQNYLKLEHSCSTNNLNSRERDQCNLQSTRRIGTRRRSDLTIPNLTSSCLYKPIYRPRSPSYERTSQKSQIELCKQFLLNDEIKPHSPVPVVSSAPPYNFGDEHNNCGKLSHKNSCRSEVEHLKDFKLKKQFFENEIKRIRGRWPQYEKESNYYSCGDMEKKLMRSCDGLEKSITKHEDYISRLDRRRRAVGGACPTPRCTSLPRPPSDYLQHLIEVRRNVVNITKQNYDSPFHSFHGFV